MAEDRIWSGKMWDGKWTAIKNIASPDDQVTYTFVVSGCRTRKAALAHCREVAETIRKVSIHALRAEGDPSPPTACAPGAGSCARPHRRPVLGATPSMGVLSYTTAGAAPTTGGMSSGSTRPGEPERTATSMLPTEIQFHDT